MPPKKGNSSSSSSSDEAKTICDYLIRSNRPYSANDISSQLHGLVSPAGAKKILNELADDNKIQRKVNGKQLVFFAIQSDIDVPSIEEAEQEQEKIMQLEEELAERKEQSKVLSGKLHALTNALTDDQMRERIAQLSMEVAENEQRLENLRRGEVISPEEKEKIETAHSAMVKHWAKRKRLFKNIENAIAEGYPGKMKDLFAELGIETDEDVGADVNILKA
ncbi:PSMC3 interacting protein [Linderina macrospora]|uniref:PSMC3 interacting protein n=1 Tax=Linderina macrospora TaxID=4868 RepID=A0ACC1J2X9_9FUNG|nr:PSMC3 interacting protein [Linderina macrospora]